MSKDQYQKYFKLLIASTLVWGVGGTWWYVCRVQYLCEKKETIVVQNNKGAEKPEAAESVKVVDGTPVTPKPVVKRVLFLPDSAEYLEDNSTYFDEVAVYMKTVPAARLVATGYTADLASEITLDSLVLGKQRAEAVKRQLVDRGVSVVQITTDSKGITVPVNAADTEEGAQQNRRVEIVIN